MAAEVVSQRLNRRKIDLIPLAEWADPPKAQIDRLLAAVETRLAAANIDGLPEVVALAEQAARDAGLADPRVTSDAKHVEIGLTDKSDAAQYLYAELFRSGIGPGLVLLAGDELGPLGGLAGSDSFLMVPEFGRAVAVSVGVEPNGVPSGVIHLGGGPALFRDLLADQARRRRDRDAPDVDVAAGWNLSFRGITHERERAVEALLTLADGTIGTQGAPLLPHPSATPTVVASLYRGIGPETDLVDLPHWERLHAEGTADADIAACSTFVPACSPSGRMTVAGCRSVRFSSLARPGVAVLRVEGGPVAIRPGPPLAAPDDDTDTIEQSDVPSSDGEPEWTVLRADGGAITVAAVQELDADGHLDRVTVYHPSDIAGAPHDALAAPRRCATRRVRDPADRAPACLGRTLGCCRHPPRRRRPLATRAPGCALPPDVVGRGPGRGRGRRPRPVGHAYRGHVFWDADVFVLPFLAATHPDAARAMLEYRAAQAPRRAGRRACGGPARRAVPVGVGVDGQGCHAPVGPRPNRSPGADPHRRRRGAHRGRRRVGCILLRRLVGRRRLRGRDRSSPPGRDRALLGVACSCRVRRDRAPLRRHRTRRVPRARRRQHVHERHGPLEPPRGGRLGARPRRRRRRRAHSAGWTSPTALVDGYDSATGVYEQFAGFYDLEPLLIAEVAPRRPIVADLLLGRDRVRGAQVIKQPDVLMAHHLVPDELHPGSLLPNLDYYEPRTAHGSSLSPGVHAAVLARAGRLDEAVEWLHVAADVDLSDVTATTAGGLHVATMGSVWQALTWGFAGLRARPDGLAVDPRLPEAWEELEVRVRFRGVPVRVRITPDTTTVVSDRLTRVLVGAAAHACGPDGISFPNQR